ncbi:MAG: hypothetical protein ACYTG5_01545 [Planctomycetota bacterium]|jgi:hypothetical protein
MSQKSRATLATAGLAVAASLLALAPSFEAPQARASQGELFPDTDGDLLPDALEFGTFSNPALVDSDGDGIDDFLATVMHLRSDPLASTAGVQDHEMRILLSSETREDGARALWMHMLFRFVGDTIPPIERLDPYIDWRTWRLPLSQLVGYGQSEIRFKQHPDHGLFVLVNLELGTEDDIRFIRPHTYTIGVDASLDGKETSSGVFIQSIEDPTGGDVFASLVPMNSGQVSYQFLNQGDSENPFWSSDRICIMTLEVFSRGTEGHICEIIDAACEPLEGNFRCPPTCPQTVGTLMFFPAGMTTIFGG